MDFASRLLGPKEGEEPLDMGCGSLHSVRATDLAMIGVYHYSLKRPAEMQRKVYPAYAINLTLAGTWQYRYKSTRYDLTPGCVTVGFPGDEYWCGHSSAHPNSNFILGLAPEAIDEDAHPLFKAPVMTNPDLGPYIVRASGCTDDEEFHSLIYEIFDIVSQDSYKGERRETGNHLRVQRMRRFIERHLFERITLADVAESVGVNPYTCLRQFKAATGETPLFYITRCRIDKAKTLLKSERISIEEVARRAGFTSHSYFCRTFKKLSGLSPTEYRRIEQRA